MSEQPNQPDTVNKTLVVLDDSSTVQTLVEKCFSGVHNITVVPIGDPKYFVVDYYGRHPIDLLILDVNMPGLSGLEVLNHMYRLPYKYTIPPIVILTSAVINKRIKEYKFIKEVVAKPDGYKELKNIVLNILTK